MIITGNGLRAVSQFLIEAENTLLNSPTTKPSITMTSVDSTSGVQWSYNPVTKLETLKLSMSDVGYGAAAWTDAGGADSNEETDLMLFELSMGTVIGQMDSHYPSAPDSLIRTGEPVRIRCFSEMILT